MQGAVWCGPLCVRARRLARVRHCEDLQVLRYLDEDALAVMLLLYGVCF